MRVAEDSVDATWRTYTSLPSLKTWDGLSQAWTRVVGTDTTYLARRHRNGRRFVAAKHLGRSVSVNLCEKNGTLTPTLPRIDPAASKLTRLTSDNADHRLVRRPRPVAICSKTGPEHDMIVRSRIGVAQTGQFNVVAFATWHLRLKHTT